MTRGREVGREDTEAAGCPVWSDVRERVCLVVKLKVTLSALTRVVSVCLPTPPAQKITRMTILSLFIFWPLRH